MADTTKEDEKTYKTEKRTVKNSSSKNRDHFKGKLWGEEEEKTGGPADSTSKRFPLAPAEGPARASETPHPPACRCRL